MPEVPEFFQQAVRSYDSCLRVRYSPPLERFVLERRIHNADPRVIDKMRGMFFNRANRPIPGGLPGRDEALALGRRYVAQAWLSALNDDHRLLEVLAGVTSTDLHELQQWLKASDQWVTAKYDGKPGETADRIAARQLYEEDQAAERREVKRREEIRERASEAWDGLRWRTGQRVSLAGA